MKKRFKAPFRVTVCVDSTKSMGQVAFQGIVEFARETSCKWVLRSSVGSRLSLPNEIDNIPAGEFDGIISFASDASTVARLRDAGVRWVSIFNDPPEPSIPAVLSDNAVIGRLAAAHLVELQLKRFVYYGTDLVINSEARFMGFAKCLAGQKAGKPVHIKIGAEDVMRSSSVERGEYLRQLGGELLAITNDGRDAVGVFAYSDNMGITVIDACREVGLAVPDKVAVIAVAADEILCELSDPPLTTIVQDARKIGREAAAMLDALLRGRSPRKRRVMVLPLGIKVRASTDVFATEDPYVIKALRIMRERFRSKINLFEMCETLKIARRPFEKRFRLALGRAPYEELRRIRIRHAEALLVQTSDPVPVIAMKSGFGCERRFFSCFKRLTGLSPVKYRKKRGALKAEDETRSIKED